MATERWAVTAIIAAHNAAHTLGAALESVAAQTLRPAMVIVVDDGSGDETGAVALSHGATVIRHEEARGAGAARNAALRAAETEFCAFLDADDAWLPNHLEIHRDVLDANTDARLIFTGSQRFTVTGQPMGVVRAVDKQSEVSVPDLLLQRVRPTVSATTVHRSTVLGVGGFSEYIVGASCEDHDLWLRIAERHPAIAHPRITARYKVDDHARSSERLDRELEFRLQIANAALERIAADRRLRAQVWAQTWLDVGKTHLKHGSRRHAAQGFAKSWRAVPSPRALAWLGLALAPDHAHRTLRQLARRGRRRGQTGQRLSPASRSATTRLRS